LMPTLPELLRQLQFITQEMALLGLFVTAGVILVGRDWRVLILALLAQYILVGLILSRLVRPDIATLQVMIGAFICPILFLSARRVSSSSFAPVLALNKGEGYELANWRRTLAVIASFIKGPVRRRRPPATGFVFRIFTLLLLILVATNLTRSAPLAGLSPSVNTAVYWLVLVGLITLTLTEDPLKTGHGLFTALTGFELFYATVERGLLLTGLWGAVKLLIALAIGYLTVVRGTGPEEEW
ncbi:MAG: hypothetical protein AB1801_25450, partial [Chloroflexota bacterium]